MIEMTLYEKMVVELSTYGTAGVLVEPTGKARLLPVEDIHLPYDDEAFAKRDLQYRVSAELKWK